MDVIRAERAHHVHGEEGQPAHDEAADDDAQGLRRLRLHAKSLHLRTALSHESRQRNIFNTLTADRKSDVFPAGPKFKLHRSVMD